MGVRAKRKEGESAAQLLRRFSTRFQKSGTVAEFRRRSHRIKPINERRKHDERLYRLKLEAFIATKVKEGMSFDQAHQLGRKYINHLTYTGS